MKNFNVSGLYFSHMFITASDYMNMYTSEKVSMATYGTPGNVWHA